MAKKNDINIDHFCIDTVLTMYAERDNKRLKKLEKNKKEEDGIFHLEITLGNKN